MTMATSPRSVGHEARRVCTCTLRLSRLTLVAAVFIITKRHADSHRPFRLYGDYDD